MGFVAKGSGAESVNLWSELVLLKPSTTSHKEPRRIRLGPPNVAPNRNNIMSRFQVLSGSTIGAILWSRPSSSQLIGGQEMQVSRDDVSRGHGTLRITYSVTQSECNNFFFTDL